MSIERWVVKLDPPHGSRPELVTFIELAQQTIQTSADLLATGVPSQAPDVLKLLRDEKLVHDDDKDEKKSALADGYSSRLKEFRGIKDDIGKQDDSVDWSAYGTYDISSGAFLAVKEHVKDLKAILRATPGPSPGSSSSRVLSKRAWRLPC